MSRLDSILLDYPDVEDEDLIYELEFGLEPESEFTKSEYPCQSLNCECGETVLYIMIPTYPFVFGYQRGLPIDLAFVTAGYEIKRGVLPLFSRCALAMPQHVALDCPNCREITPVQMAKDGGLLPVGTLQKTQRPVPTSRLQILNNPKEEWQR